MSDEQNTPIPQNISIYQGLFDHAPIGHLLLDSAGIIIQANHAICAMLGLDRQELCGQHIGIWVAPQHHQLIQQALQKLQKIRQGAQWHQMAQTPSLAELRLQRADGQSCFVQAQMVSILLEGSGQTDGDGLKDHLIRHHLLLSLTEITALKKAQSDLEQLNLQLERQVSRRSADAEALAEEMVDLTQSVSQDLSEPLRHIQTFALKLRSEALSEAGERALETIAKAAEQAQHGLEALAHYTRACNSHLNLTEVNLERVLDAAISEWRHNECQHDQLPEQPQLQIERQPLPQAFCDAQSMQLVLLELLCNSSKACAGQPNPKVNIWGEEEAGTVKIYLQDNGMGFQAAYAGSIFEVFRKLHSPRQFVGRGVGLAVARRLMLRQHGDIHASSKGEGLGAVMVISLPAAKKP